MSPEPEQVQLVNRREAIRRVSGMLGGVAFSGGAGLLAAVERAAAAAQATSGQGAQRDFSIAQIEFLDEIAETILPATKTPGAKAAKTGAFMALIVTDCYGPDEQKTFRAGMSKVDQAMQQANKVSFMEATQQQRLAVLTTLDQEQKRVMDARAAAREAAAREAADRNVTARHDKEPAHYFRMMKELTLLGYFTSEIGCTQAMRYLESPGRFDPCIPYIAGEPAWASHA
ncbi:MAG: gluconate 2-dehydrogenase subunit 3 family protein [Gammaproteobacteria bacterium]